MTDPSSNPPPNPQMKPRRRRWLKWTLLTLASVVAALYLLVPLIAAPILRSKLESMVDSQLNARLDMRRVIYVFPYGLRVSDAKLITPAPDGTDLQLLHIPSLEISLAKLPFGEGPLLIRKLYLHDPAIHLIHTDAGLVGRQTLAKPDVPKNESQPPRKLSDMFQLRHVRITRGQVLYEDRANPAAVPVAWKDININLTTRPTTNPLYEFQLLVANKLLANADVAGTFDIDALNLTVERMRVTMQHDPGATESPAPIPLQRFLADNNLHGLLSIDGRAALPVRDPAAATFDATIKLTNDASTSPTSPALTVRCSTSPLHPEQIANATTTRPTSAPATTPSRPAPALYFLAQDGRQTYGENTLLLHNASVVLNWDAGRYDLHALRARLTLGQDKRPLPKFLRAAFEGPEFLGTIDFTATGRGPLGSKSAAPRAYRFDIHATSPRLTATSRRLLFTDVTCDFAVTPGLVEFIRDDDHEGIRAGVYGGTLAARGRIGTRKPVGYEFLGTAHGVDLKQLAAAWARENEQPPKLTGTAAFNLRFSGSASHEGKRGSELFIGDGDVEIINGDFYEFPVLADIVAAVAPSRDAATVGQAAGVFDIADRRIRFSKAAVSAPLLGLQGSGDATFDGALNFRVVAAPLSDWRKQLQKSRIPILGDIGADLLGGIQKLLNTASGKLLYHFKIEGTTSHPKVMAEPVPLLTEDALKLFVEMLRGKKEDRLLERIRMKKPPK